MEVLPEAVPLPPEEVTVVMVPHPQFQEVAAQVLRPVVLVVAENVAFLAAAAAETARTVA